MFLINLFKLKKECTHDRISPEIEGGYCPDCGKLIKNEWYIARCSCCGVKLKAIIKNGEVCPENHYCVNCGNQNFNIEKLKKINFIDINFAVLQKNIIIEDTYANTTQCWTEKNNEQPKLLKQYL